VIFWIIWIR